MVEVGIEVDCFCRETAEGLEGVVGIQGNVLGKSVGIRVVEVDNWNFVCIVWLNWSMSGFVKRWKSEKRNDLVEMGILRLMWMMLL